MRAVRNSPPLRVIVLLLSAGLFEGFLPTASGEGSPSCETSRAQQEVEGVVDAFVTAWNQDDAASLVSLFAEEGEFTSPSGKTVQGRGEIRQLVAEERKEMFKDTTLTLSLQDQHPSKNGTVLLEGTYTVQAAASPLGVVELSSEGSFQFTMQPHGCAYRILQARTHRP